MWEAITASTTALLAATSVLSALTTASLAPATIGLGGCCVAIIAVIDWDELLNVSVHLVVKACHVGGALTSIIPGRLAKIVAVTLGAVSGCLATTTVFITAISAATAATTALAIAWRSMLSCFFLRSGCLLTGSSLGPVCSRILTFATALWLATSLALFKGSVALRTSSGCAFLGLERGSLVLVCSSPLISSLGFRVFILVFFKITCRCRGRRRLRILICSRPLTRPSAVRIRLVTHKAL